VAARVLLFSGAIAALVFAGIRHHDAGRCADARTHAFALGQRRAIQASVDATVRDLTRYCRGASDIAAGAGSLQRIAALDAAEQLALRAVDREPDNEDGWLALALVDRRRGDAAGARVAIARVRVLDPRYRGLR
jgi:hypothetical protein